MVTHLKMIVSAVLILLLYSAIFGDTITLKNDSKIEGKIISKTNGQVVIRTANKIEVVPYLEIKAIEFPRPVFGPRFCFSFNFLGTLVDAINGMFGLDLMLEYALGRFLSISCGSLVLPVEGDWVSDTKFAASIGFRIYPFGVYRSFYLGAEGLRIFGDDSAYGILFSFGFAGSIAENTILSGGVKFRFLEYPYERDVVLNMNVGLKF